MMLVCALPFTSLLPISPPMWLSCQPVLSVQQVSSTHIWLNAIWLPLLPHAPVHVVSANTSDIPSCDLKYLPAFTEHPLHTLTV